MKKNIISRIVFGSALVAILIFSGIVFLNTADKSFGQGLGEGECFPESSLGANDGFCMGIIWTPAADSWHSDRSAVIFRADPNITPTPTADEVRDYGLFPTSCTTGLNYGDTCGPVCYTYKRGAQICRQSPINRFDNLPPVCGSWTRSGNTFTLSGSTDAPASGSSGSSGIQVSGGTCPAAAGGICTVDIYDVAANKTTCTSPVNPMPTYSCSGPAPTNANLCSGDDSGLGAPATNRLVPACTIADKCEFTCNSGYVYENRLGIPACVPSAIPALSCSPASQSIGVGLGARVGASGGTGTYNWSVSGSSCFGEVEPGNPAVYWAGCNAAGVADVIVSDGSGQQASCGLVVTSAQPLSCSPATQTVAELQGANFSAVGGSGTLRWSAGGTPAGSPMAGTGNTFWTSYSRCGEKTITVTDDLGASASCGLTVTGASCEPGPVCNYNGIQDNGETGVDCGGGGCVTCPIPPGSCPLYESNPHYVCQNYSCARVDACGVDSGGCTSVRFGMSCGSSLGSIVVTSNNSDASWVITGPSFYSGGGLYARYDNAPEGSYILIPGSGYSVDFESRYLRAGSEIEFYVYKDSSPPPTCFISAIPSSQSANIGSNASFTAVTTCSDGSTPPENIDLTDWSVNKSATFVSGQSNSRTTTLRCDSSTGGVPAVVTPTLGALVSISSNLSCNPVLTCSPVNQTADTNQNVSFSASGGSTYSWTATSGTPAGGSSASFSTRYVTAGNKTVSVESGENTAYCSVNVIQPRHNECVMVNGAPACTAVDGRAPDRCNTAADCGAGSCNYNGIKDNGETGVDCGGGGCPACGGNPPLKYSCASGSCQVDSSGPYTDSTCGGVCTATYYSCSNGSCVSDSSGQFTSANCNNMCVAPIYGRCSAASRACVNTTDPSGEPCSGDLICGTTGETHLGCIGNACVIMSGPGSDVCGAVGEACATDGGGRCSLKASPPLVSGGQSVKLTWQCAGAPTCSLTRKYNNSNTTITLQDPATRTTGTYSDKPVSSGIYTLDCDVSTADATASVKVSTLIECAPTDPGCKP